MSRIYEDHRDVESAFPDAERVLWRREEGGIMARDVSPANLAIGAVRGFRLRACPTVCRAGRRHGLRGEAALFAWLGRKASEAGFEVLGARAIDEGYVNAKNDKQGARYRSVDFRGVLRVVDVERFEGAYQRGIGPAKAFGFGMLVLSQPPTEDDEAES